MPLQMPVPDDSPLGSGHTPVLARQLSIPYVAPMVCGNRRFVRTKGELQKAPWTPHGRCYEDLSAGFTGTNPPIVAVAAEEAHPCDLEQSFLSTFIAKTKRVTSLAHS